MEIMSWESNCIFDREYDSRGPRNFFDDGDEDISLHTLEIAWIL